MAHPLMVGLIFGVALLGVGILAGIGLRLYADAHPPASDCFCLNPHGYWQNPESHAGAKTYDADGSRHTARQPAHYEQTIWLFGNSGTEDPFVDDAHTMASQLQALLLASGYRWRVVNHSVGGQKISGELAWLKDTPVRPGDMVVFIDGSMDRLIDTPLPRYQASIESARAYAHQAGALFYHFAQPYIDPAWCCAQMGAPRLYVPPGDFVDTSHMTAAGDSIVALALYRALTTF